MTTIIGITGAAGSGKDTFADMIDDLLPVKAIAFADPIKEFAKKVFLFSDDQLWGPTHYRNAVDPRYSPVDPTLPILKLYEVVRRKLGGIERARKEALDRYEDHRLDFILETMVDGWPSKAGAKLDEVVERLFKERQITPRLVLQLLGTEYGRALRESIWIDVGLRRAAEIKAFGVSVVIKDTRFVNEAEAIRRVGGRVVRIRRPSLDTSAVEAAGVRGHASEQDIYSDSMTQFVTDEILNDGTLDDLRLKACVFVRSLV